MFSILFSFIYTSEGSELIVLWSLLHRNPFFLNLLFDLGGIDLLKDIIVEKQLDGRMDSNNLFYLFNIAWNEPISTVIELPVKEEVKKEEEFETTYPKPKTILKFNEAMMDFLDIIILVAKKGKKKLKVVKRILIVLDYLLQDDSNKEKFHNRYGKQLIRSLEG